MKAWHYLFDIQNFLVRECHPSPSSAPSCTLTSLFPLLLQLLLVLLLLLVQLPLVLFLLLLQLIPLLLLLPVLHPPPGPAPLAPPPSDPWVIFSAPNMCWFKMLNFWRIENWPIYNFPPKLPKCSILMMIEYCVGVSPPPEFLSIPRNSYKTFGAVIFW